MMYNIRSGAIQLQIPDSLYDSCIAHHLQDFQSFNLENEGQGQEVEERNLRHSTGNVRFHVGDFFIIFATWQHTFTQKGNTYI